MFYSKSTGGFYDRTIHGGNIPADAVEITAEEHQALLEGQSQGKRIVAGSDGRPMLASPPPETSDQVWVRIKAERDKRKTGGVKVGDKWFHSDDASRIQQLSLVLLGDKLPDNLMWKTMDGSFIKMTPSLAKSVFDTQIENDSKIFAIAERHKQNMSKEEDPSLYDYSVGWPKIYGE